MLSLCCLPAQPCTSPETPNTSQLTQHWGAHGMLEEGPTRWAFDGFSVPTEIWAVTSSKCHPAARSQEATRQVTWTIPHPPPWSQHCCKFRCPRRRTEGQVSHCPTVERVRCKVPLSSTLTSTLPGRGQTGPPNFTAVSGQSISAST